MKAGILHLRKKMEGEKQPESVDDNGPRPPAFVEQHIAETAPPSEPTCEMDEPAWSVVSFDQMEAGGLTYLQASKLMAELDSVGVAGLCIVTDAAAKRMKS